MLYIKLRAVHICGACFRSVPISFVMTISPAAYNNLSTGEWIFMILATGGLTIKHFGTFLIWLKSEW
jgi:hypothetical protein